MGNFKRFNKFGQFGKSCILSHKNQTSSLSHIDKKVLDIKIEVKNKLVSLEKAKDRFSKNQIIQIQKIREAFNSQAGRLSEPQNKWLNRVYYSCMNNLNARPQARIHLSLDEIKRIALKVLPKKTFV